MSKPKPIPVFIDAKSKEIIFSDMEDPWIHLKDSYWIPALGYRLKEFDGHTYIAGATNAGKSYYIQQMILNDKKKRIPIVFTDLDSKDKTFDKMHFITFEGDKDGGKYNWEWLEQNKKGKIFIFDDSEDNPKYTEFRNKMLKEARHLDTIVICVNHKLNDWYKTNTPKNECEFIVTFPGSNKGDVIKYLKNELGLDPKARNMIANVATTEGRHLVIHKHYPQMIATTESVFRL